MNWKGRRLWLQSTVFEIEIIEGLRWLVLTMRVKRLRENGGQDHYREGS